MTEKLLDLIFEEPALNDELVNFSVRLRLARNLKKYPFPHQMNEKLAGRMREEVIEAVYMCIDRPFLIVHMAETDKLVRQLMVERHIISPEFAEDGFGKTLIWVPSYGLRILVNEEDHLRICCCATSGNSAGIWKILDNFDSRLSEKLEFAFDREFGYLTSCLTNIGPALRISSITFLPSLKATRKIKKVFEIIYKLGYIIRGFYGEGSATIADFYQIATGNVLGKSEIEICESFDALAGAIQQQETESLACVNVGKVKRSIEIFINRIFRDTSGISFDQAINGISLLLFGKKLGIIQAEENLLKRLIYRIMPASIQIETGMHLNEKEQANIRKGIVKQALRSQYVRTIL